MHPQVDITKIAEKVLGWEPAPRQVPESDLVVSVVGDDVSLSLVANHLIRSEAVHNKKKKDKD